MPGTKLSIIPQRTKVLYGTYAAISALTATLKTQDLAYATDRKILYRWNGTTLNEISTPPVIFNATEVFNGTAPTNFAYLDLTSIIGANNAYIQICIQNGDGNSHVYTFRETDSIPGEPLTIPAGRISYTRLFRTTDEAPGFTWWKCDAAVATIIWMAGYIR